MSLTGIGGNQGTGSFVPAVTWDNSNKSTHIVLSGSNLIETNNTFSNAYNLVRGNAGQSSGKFYNEFTITSLQGTDNAVPGYTDSTITSYDDNTVICTNNHGVCYASDGNVYGATTTAIGTYAQGAVIGMAIDIDNLKIWFTLDGTHWNSTTSTTNSPAANIGGISISGITLPVYAAAGNARVSASITVNFGASSYSYTKPSGFSNW